MKLLRKIFLGILSLELEFLAGFHMYIDINILHCIWQFPITSHHLWTFMFQSAFHVRLVSVLFQQFSKQLLAQQIRHYKNCSDGMWSLNIVSLNVSVISCRYCWWKFKIHAPPHWKYQEKIRGSVCMLLLSDSG